MTQKPAFDPAVRSLALVRIFILAGILLAGGVIWLLHTKSSWTPAVPQFPVRPIAIGLWASAVVGILGIRYMWGTTIEVKRRVHYSIIALAIAEAPALYGAVVYFLTGDPRLYLTGVFLMLTTLILFPIVRHR